MKYVIILGDGMADRPIPELGNMTPLEYASTPVLDELARDSEIGMLRTIPEGMKPGSDTANLAVLGYDPKRFYSGRSPLEALSIGIPLKDTDIAIRMNLVTLTEDPGVPFEEQVILDHSSDEISTEDAAVLVDAVRSVVEQEGFRVYVGTSYRHCLIWENGDVPVLAAPHDHLEQKIGPFLPENRQLRHMMEESYRVLKDHPMNRERREKGLNPANCCWFWGAGTKPMLQPFEELTGKKGAMISAVDLLKGIAVGASMRVIHVEGANGGLNTNYEGKAMAAVRALRDEGDDFVYIHVEGPDEMGHQGSAERKVRSIEYLDGRIIGIVRDELKKSGLDFRMAVLPDHPTPVSVRTHTAEPVPCLLYDSRISRNQDWHYNEREAEASGLDFGEGPMLIRRLFENP